MNKIVVNDYPLAIITNNTCNLTCSNCGSINNYNFNGVSRWNTLKHYYEKWSEIIEFSEIDILGGEPFLNPDLEQWAMGIKTLWPTAWLSIGTNGTLLKLDKNIKLCRRLIDAGIIIKVSCHSRDHYREIENSFWKIFQGLDITEQEDFSDNAESKRRFLKDGKVIAEIHEVYYFFPNFTKEVKNGIIYLDQGDQEASHNNCIYSTSTFAIQDGLFYKCPLVYTYAQGKKQFNYEPYARALLEQYKACSPYDSQEKILDFFANLTKSIPQCQLCAFEKKTRATDKWIPIVFDKSNKKMFKPL